MPGFRVRVLAQNSARGTVYCKKASAGAHTAFSRPPTRSPSTARRRYSYSLPAPSRGRSTKSRGGNTAAGRPNAARSAAKRVASASPAVTTSRLRPSPAASRASSWARPAGGRPNSAAGPLAARPPWIFWYSVERFRVSNMHFTSRVADFRATGSAPPGPARRGTQNQRCFYFSLSQGQKQAKRVGTGAGFHFSGSRSAPHLPSVFTHKRPPWAGAASSTCPNASSTLPSARSTPVSPFFFTTTHPPVQGAG